MNKRQKEILQNELKSERTVLNQIRAVYQRAYIDIEKKIEKMQMRINRDAADTAAIYQKQFQEALKAQVAAILDNLNSEQYDTIQDYIEKCYEDGFIGTMYDLQGQGIPLVIPIDQELVSKAIQHDTKLKAPMYEELGYNVEQLKKTISGELARGIANAYSFSEIARNISRHGNVTMNKAYTIARTEGHRITEQSRQDARQKAKEAGADVVKQWDSTMDKRTRETHVKLDGQIRELDEPFEVNGHKAMYPGGFGVAKEDINCRCTALQRARWALDEEELKVLEERAKLFGVDKSESIADFKKKYLKAVEKLEQNDRMKSNKGMFPDSIAGVKRGDPMAFEDADNFRVNPNYGKAPGYSINCQSCVVTFEARQRGYDVQVLPNTRGSMASKLSYHTNLAWIDTETKEHPKYIYDDSAKTPKKYLSFIKNTIEQGARYTIEFSWKGRSRSGHIVNLDRNEAGELRIKDNQRGQGERNEWIGDEEVLSYLSRMKYTTTVYGTKFAIVPKILRIDNMEFDESVINEIMEGVK